MGWATCDRGHVHWGARGAAGLLLAEHGRVLLQLRAAWTHQGGTWSVPGGARERGEDWTDAALREAREELGVRREDVTVVGSSTAVCGGWAYCTVLATPTAGLAVSDLSESDRHAWVPAADVAGLPLHPAFRLAWEAGDLRAFVESTGQ